MQCTGSRGSNQLQWLRSSLAFQAPANAVIISPAVLVTSLITPRGCDPLNRPVHAGLPKEEGKPETRVSSCRLGSRSKFGK